MYAGGWKAGRKGDERVEDTIGERREKPRGIISYPYRKPTQVGRKKILRPTGEGLLRNSAKCPRNFGRRGAAEMQSQRRGPGNCLAKTQVCAKSKDDVYGLTPARCRKVKGNCESNEPKPR